MRLKDIHTLPPGWLIKMHHPGMIGNGKGDKWIVGIPRKKEFWECIVLASNGSSLWNHYNSAILSSDKLIPMPPQDIVKYLNYLTDKGVQYLKGLQL